MKLTDGRKTIKITMHEFDGANLSPDWSLDFFDAGGLAYSDEVGAYIVNDVYYCLGQALDWKHARCDFAEEGIDPESRVVNVEVVSSAR